MKVKALIQKEYSEIEIHVCNHEKNERVKDVVKQIDSLFNLTLKGTDERGVRLIRIDDVMRFYAQNRKVMAQDMDGSVSIPLKLYELEEMLDDTKFVRISKSEIVNLNKVKRLDMSISGTIKVIFRDESWTYTSRRNVARLKKALGLEGRNRA